MNYPSHVETGNQDERCDFTNTSTGRHAACVDIAHAETAAAERDSSGGGGGGCTLGARGSSENGAYGDETDDISDILGVGLLDSTGVNPRHDRRTLSSSSN